MEMKVEDLMNLDAEFVMEPGVNKWKCIIWGPVLLKEIQHSGYYQSYYRYIFQGRTG